MIRKIQNLLGNKKAPEPEFVEWCSEKPQLTTNLEYDLNSFRQQNPPPPKNPFEEFFIQISAALKQSVIKKVRIESSTSGPKELKGNGPDYVNYIYLLSVNDLNDKLSISGVAIWSLQLGPNISNLHIKKCKIANLITHSHTNIDLVLEDTDIGRITLMEGSISSLDVNRGSILRIKCGPPGSGNPFKGSVTFKGTFLPTSRHDYLFSGPQPYRNMRHHLKSLENAQMANLFHSVELATERLDDTVPNKIFSYCYAAFSDYGSSAFRPLLWLLATYLISAMLVYFSSGAVIPDPASLSGWKNVLAEGGVRGDISRSLVLALQPIVNPLQIFSVKALLDPRTGWIFVLMIVQSFLSIIWIALAVFAIRRRFKMQ